MRESYRLNKQILSGLDKGNIIIGLIYVSSEIATFQVIEKKIKKILTTIKEKPLSDKINP
jgi:ribonuclease P protein component